MTSTEMSLVVSKKKSDDQDFEDYAGTIEFLDDRMYIVADGVTIGIDRYVLDELVSREEDVIDAELSDLASKCSD